MLEKKKNLEIGIGCILVLILIFTISGIIKEIKNKNEILYSLTPNNNIDIKLGYGDYVFSTSFLEKDILSLRISVKSISGDLEGNIGYTIKDEVELLSGIISSTQIKNQGSIVLDLSSYPFEKNKEYSLIMYSRIKGTIIVPASSDNELITQQTFKNGYKLYYGLVIVALVVVFGLVIILLFKLKQETIKIFLLIVLIGVIAVFIIPPSTAPDELRHFYRAYSITEGNLICKEYSSGEEYYYQHLALCDVDSTFNKFKLLSESSNEHWTGETNNLIFLPKWIALLNEDFSNEKVRVPYHGASVINPVAYIPQILFIFLAKIFQFNPIWIYYMARLGNVVVVSLIAFLAIKINNRFKNFILILLLSPGMIFLRSTCSTDAFLLVLMLLFLSIFLKVMENNEKKFCDSKIYFSLLVIISCIGLIKLPYILCSGVLLFINRKKFITNNKYAAIKKYIIIFSYVVIPVLLYFLSNKLFSYYSMEVQTVKMDYLIYLFKNPLEIIGLIIRTFAEGFIDTIQSSLMYPESKGLFLIYLFVVFYYGLVQKEESYEKMFRDKTKFLWLGCFLWCAILGTFYFVGPSPDIGYIWGVQARYIYPILPIGLLAFVYHCEPSEYAVRMKGNKYLYFIAGISLVHILRIYSQYWI